MFLLQEANICSLMDYFKKKKQSLWPEDTASSSMKSKGQQRASLTGNSRLLSCCNVSLGNSALSSSFTLYCWDFPKTEATSGPG